MLQAALSDALSEGVLATLRKLPGRRPAPAARHLNPNL